MTEAITGGDDYELLFAVRPLARPAWAAARGTAALPLTRIGVCTADRAVVLRHATASIGDRRFPGYSHFR